MAKGKVLTTNELPRTGAIEETTEAAAPSGETRQDGMIRLQQVTGGTVCIGGNTKGSTKGRSALNPAYRWSGHGVQTVPLAVAREVLCKFRNRFRALDPM